MQPRFGFTYKLTHEDACCAAASGLFVAPFQITGVPGIGNPINQFGYSRNTPVDHQPRQRPHLRGRPRPARCRAARCSSPIGSSQGLRTNLGGNLGHRPPPASSRRSAATRSSGASPSASSASCPANFLVELTYLGQRGPEHPVSCRQLNFVPQQFRTQSPTATTPRPRRSSTPARAQPVPRPHARERGRPTAPPSPRRRLLQAYPQFGTLRDGDLRRLEPATTAATSAWRSASPTGSCSSTSYTYSRVPREGGAAQPLGGPGRRVRRRGPAAPHHLRDRGRAARSARAASSAPTGAAWWTRILGGWQLARPLRVADGPAARPGTTSTSIPACGDPKDVLTVELGPRLRGQEVRRGRARSSTRRASTRSTASSSATPPGNVVTFQAPEIQLRRGQHPPLPHARCPTCASRATTSWTSASPRTSCSARA